MVEDENDKNREHVPVKDIKEERTLPPVEPHIRYNPIDLNLAQKAIELVKRALPYVTAGPPLISYGPRGEVHVDIPLMYQGFALDRMHYDPLSKTLSPKGRPVEAIGIRVDSNEVFSLANSIIKELKVVEAVEYRKPEAVWIVPVAWRSLIVAHIKVTHSSDSLVPDYGLTEEVRRHVA